MVESHCPLPDALTGLEEPEVMKRLEAAKAALGSRVVILGHHYQRDDIIRFADFTGDSLKLSQLAAGRGEAEYIVFCGVHFMAEAADILCAPHQQVILPDLSAGCSMADMAHLDEVEYCWQHLTSVLTEPLIPLTYINSAASLKAFVGRHGGAVCTSSNADKVLAWALEQGKHVLFFPDQHLGRNTGLKRGFDHAEMRLWERGGASAQADAARWQAAKLILWDGYCSVHQMFTVGHLQAVREADPEMRVIVHPECPYEVVEAADAAGSTEAIIKAVEQSPPGSKWAVGTEINLVHRLANRFTDRTVISLNPSVCVCSTMYRIDPKSLLWVLESLVEGRVVNRITVSPEVKKWSLVALNRMLEIV